MEIIKRPFITEKSMQMAVRGLYTFVVALKATKPQIADAIKKQYKVTPISVRTMTTHGKIRRVGRKMLPLAKPDWKKAFVVLKAGQKIEAFEVSKEEGKK